MDKEALKVLLGSIFENSTSSSSSDSDLSDLSELSEDEIVLKLYKTPPAKKPCLKKFFEDDVASCNEQEFRAYFHINQKLFKSLTKKFTLSQEFSRFRQHKAASPEKHIAIFLWYLTHRNCGYRDLVERFNLSVFTVERIIRRVAKFLANMQDTVITWPDEVQKEIISDSFEQICGFPGVIGSIGTTRILIDPPPKSGGAYIGKNGCNGLVFQGVCDDSRKFIDLRVGFPPKYPPYKVFCESGMSSCLENYCEDSLILGSSSYPCLKNLLTPYKDHGILSKEQKHYNEKFEAGRSAIDRTFEMLKQRFPQLHSIRIRGLDKVFRIIKACCVLHNLAEPTDLVDLELDEHIENSSAEDECNESDSLIGMAIRDEVCEQLSDNC